LWLYNSVLVETDILEGKNPRLNRGLDPSNMETYDIFINELKITGNGLRVQPTYV